MRGVISLLGVSLHIKKNLKNTILVFLISSILIGLVLVLLIWSKKYQLFGGIIYNFNTKEKIVALTFDDGPSNKYTSGVLDILESEGVKATFFLNGADIEQNQKSAKLIYEKGHEIGNHGYSHSRLIFKSPRYIADEVEKTDNLIRELGVNGDILFRPPYGQTLYFLPKYLNEHNRLTIMYDLQIENFRSYRTKQEMISYVSENIHPGAIIVFHVMNESREQERMALTPIIKLLKENGYKITTISELLEKQKEI